MPPLHLLSFALVSTLFPLLYLFLKIPGRVTPQQFFLVLKWIYHSRISRRNADILIPHTRLQKGRKGRLFVWYGASSRYKRYTTQIAASHVWCDGNRSHTHKHYFLKDNLKHYKMFHVMFTISHSVSEAVNAASQLASRKRRLKRMLMWSASHFSKILRSRQIWIQNQGVGRRESFYYLVGIKKWAGSWKFPTYLPRNSAEIWSGKIIRLQYFRGKYMAYKVVL